MIRAILFALCVLATPASAQAYFGYSGTICGLDTPGEDFAAQVAPYTNIAHICPTGDMAQDAANLAHAHALSMTILYHAEPIFFLRDGRWVAPRRDNDLWQQTLQTIADSGVPAESIILYVMDRPALVRSAYNDLWRVFRRIRTDLPGARTMMIDALPEPRRRVWFLSDLDYWGIQAPALPNPMANEAFMEIITQSSRRLRGEQGLVVVMDATYTSAHAEAGLRPEDMAQVGGYYAALAASVRGVEILLVDAHPSAPEDLGAWDLPPEVVVAHQVIGRRITGR